MSFRCGRSFWLLGTECRPPGAKTMDVDFKWYYVDMCAVRTTIACIAVSLWPLFCGLVYVFAMFFRACYWLFHQHI